MARQYFDFALECEACGRSGTASGHDDDNGPNFQIDSLPEGFSQGSYSPNPWKQNFRCGCGGYVTAAVS